MDIRCLFGKHDWKFSYNHGMPLGINTEDALKMLKDDRSFAVYACTKCRKQSRLVDGKYVALSRGKVEAP